MANKRRNRKYNNKSYSGRINTRKRVDATAISRISRRQAQLSYNVVVPSSGFTNRIPGIPADSVRTLRSRIELCILPSKTYSVTPQMNEQIDFDASFVFGTHSDSTTSVRYVTLYTGLNTIVQFCLSKHFKVDCTNLETQKLPFWDHGYVALTKVSLFLVNPYPDKLKLTEASIGYKQQNAEGPSTAHIETLESGNGSVPYARLQIPSLDWYQLRGWKELLNKPTFKLSAWFDRNLNKLPLDEALNYTFGYLDVSVSYKYDAVYTTAATFTQFAEPNAGESRTDFLTRMGGLKLGGK